MTERNVHAVILDTDVMDVAVRADGVYFNAMLHQDNDSGVTNAVDDYKSTNRDFKFVSPGNYTVARLLVFLEADDGTFAPDSYGPQNHGPLVDGGIHLYVKPNGGSKTNITVEPITSNIQWGMYCFDTKYNAWGTSKETFQVRWSFNRSGVPGIVLSEHDELGLTFTDDFTYLDQHKFVIQGFYK